MVSAASRPLSFIRMPRVDKMSGDYIYIQIADDLQERIDNREYTIRLPGERALAAEYEVAYQTQREATKLLCQRGVTVSRQGRGTFITAEYRAKLDREKGPVNAGESETEEPED
jgi:GntR family transcriptional regulator